MNKQTFLPGLILILFFGSAVLGQAAPPGHEGDSSLLAATPPMGWNSWDGYGTTVTEADVKANAQWQAEHLKPFGWQYVVVDMEWFVTNPTPEGNSKTSQYSLDDSGRYTPAVNRGHAAGFKPLADYVHSLGLSLSYSAGRTKQAVEESSDPGSPYRGGRRTPLTCSVIDNYGLDASKPGAQAYYDRLRTLCQLGFDLIKVDCIAAVRTGEIRMLSWRWSRLAGWCLSLSPGLHKKRRRCEVCPDVANFNDIWDPWHSTVDYPQGLRQFATVAKCSKAQPGHCGCRHVLSICGSRCSQPRYQLTRRAENVSYPVVHLCFTADGGRRGPMPDDWWPPTPRSSVDQHSTGNHPAVTTDKTVVWVRNWPQRAATLWRFLIDRVQPEGRWTGGPAFTSAKYELRTLGAEDLVPRTPFTAPCRPMAAPERSVQSCAESTGCALSSPPRFVWKGLGKSAADQSNRTCQPKWFKVKLWSWNIFSGNAALSKMKATKRKCWRYVVRPVALSLRECEPVPPTAYRALESAPGGVGQVNSANRPPVSLFR